MIEGVLKFMQDSKRWAVVSKGHEYPVDIASGDVFEVETNAGMKTTRMEHSPREGYLSIDNYPLKDGLKVRLGSRGGLLY